MEERPGRLNPRLVRLAAAEDAVKCRLIGVRRQACDGGAMF